MRVSEALKQLRISFEELQEYGRLLEVDLSVSKPDVGSVLYDRIKELVNHKITRERVFEKAMQIRAKNIGAYEIDECYRVPAVVKWFGNKATGGKYGFLEVYGLGDVYFNINDVVGFSAEELRPNRIVITELLKKDFKIQNKKAANKVYLLEQEKDIKYMLYTIVVYHQSTLHNHIGSTIHDSFYGNLDVLRAKFSNEHYLFFLDSILLRIDTDLNITTAFCADISKLFKLFEAFIPDEKFKSRVGQITTEYIFNEQYSFYKYRFIIEFRKLCGLNSFKKINTRIIETSPKDDLYIWWKDYNINVPFAKLADLLVKSFLKNPSKSFEYLSKLKPAKIDIIFEEIYQKILNSDDLELGVLIEFLDLAKEYDQELNYELLGDKRLYQLWKSEHISDPPLNFIRSLLQKIKAEESNNNSYVAPRAIYTRSEREEILEKLSFQNLRDLISLIYLKEEIVDREQRFHEFLNILDNLDIDKQKKELLITIAHNNSSEWYKLRLFIADYTETIEYDDAVIYTALLDSASQKVFFKKLIKLIGEGKLDLGLDDLNRITTIDYQTSEYIKEIGDVGLDFSLSVILQLLSDLKNNKITETKTIFDLIANQIKKPDDLLVIDGFFEKCQGRTVLSYNSDTEEYNTELKHSWKPRFATFCDGRKAIDKSSGKPVTCNKSEKEFWWCENSKCYEAARNVNLNISYRNYSLQDIMQILEISYSLEQYEKLLGVINRVNRFLSHLTCRSCKTILRPIDSPDNSNYAFYRVTRFHCSNQNCEESHNQIYLSHCINGRCMDIIDSRDCVSCKPKGYSENCGWYICNHCLACCSSEKLRAREFIYNQTGQDYKCHIEGHKDLGILCCNKCGGEMEESSQYGPVYKKQLKWFIDQKNKNSNITKYGQRKDGKWWFIWDKGNYTYDKYRIHLENLYKSGFNMPDYDDITRTNQLIAEPFRENINSQYFSCTSQDCDNSYKITDLNEFDYGRQQSIFYYHDKVFKRQLAN
ncbi:hypothetical protein [Flavimarina sp. Hel_I_48]|uniref:hypothetical protein n=1 Tax=Flavimarina sp. Hel_I_48 TaxID=1392488 RepID=UPI0004DEEB45|nr:hypothetical protein [Flavimarina sp. Hel_I_48]